MNFLQESRTQQERRPGFYYSINARAVPHLRMRGTGTAKILPDRTKAAAAAAGADAAEAGGNAAGAWRPHTKMRRARLLYGIMKKECAQDVQKQAADRDGAPGKKMHGMRCRHEPEYF